MPRQADNVCACILEHHEIRSSAHGSCRYLDNDVLAERQLFARQIFARKGATTAMQEQEIKDDGNQIQTTLFRAAEYVRMSTEHQQYSTENQADKIREYAAKR